MRIRRASSTILAGAAARLAAFLAVSSTGHRNNWGRELYRRQIASTFPSSRGSTSRYSAVKCFENGRLSHSLSRLIALMRFDRHYAALDLSPSSSRKCDFVVAARQCTRNLLNVKCRLSPSRDYFILRSFVADPRPENIFIRASTPMPRMIHDRKTVQRTHVRFARETSSTSRRRSVAVLCLALRILSLFASFIYNTMEVKCKAQSGKLKRS